jgi:nitrous oxide reductase
MANTFVCINCHQLKPANIHLKGNQDYCNASECQRARKTAWQKEKITHDSNYHSQQLEYVRTWRKKRPSHQYQKQYRQDHPEYVKKNRELQIIRNRKRSVLLSFQKIVKMDTLNLPQIEKSNTYVMKPFKVDDSGKIVKMDALLAQITNLQSDIHESLPRSSEL